MIPELTSALYAVENKTGSVVTLHPNTILAQINRVCLNNDLPEVGIHGLRHSFASIGFHLRMSEREVMEIGGWSDSNTVHRIYEHLSLADKLTAQNKMKNFYSANENAK